jgi:hypothetical protein
MSAMLPETSPAVAAPAGRTPAPPSSLFARALSSYERLDDAIRIRWPYLTVLRPVPLLAYVLGAWAISAVLARLLRGTILHPLGPTPISIAWLFVSTIVAAIWVIQQWRARTSLPRSLAVPRVWSFAPTFFALVLVLSPSIVWERLAYANVRTLLSRSDCGLLVGVLDKTIASVDYGESSKPLPDVLAWVREQAPDTPKEQKLWRNSESYRFCRVLFTPHHPKVAQNIESIISSDLRGKLRPKCEKLLRASENTSEINDQELKFALWIYEFAWVRPHAIAHGFGDSAYWGQGGNQARIIALTLLLAAMVVLSVALPLVHMLRALVVEVVVVSAVVSLMDATVVWRLRSLSPSTLWITIALPASAAGLLMLCLCIAPRARRNHWSDVAFVAVWTSPLIVLGVAAALQSRLLFLYTEPITELFTQKPWRWLDYTRNLSNAFLITVLVYLISSPFIPAALTRYRRLPYTK